MPSPATLPARHLKLLATQGKRLAAAGLDVDVSVLHPYPEDLDSPARNPGRIRIKTRESTAAWSHKAQCLREGYPPALFYPTRNSTPQDILEAKAVCARCPVRLDCLSYSLNNWEKVGIWGGRTEDERRKLRRAMRVARARVTSASDEFSPKKWLSQFSSSVLAQKSSEPT